MNWAVPGASAPGTVAFGQARVIRTPLVIPDLLRHE